MKIIKDSGQGWLEFESWEDTISKLNLKYYENPDNDAKKLFNAQKDFITSKFTDQNAEAQLFLISEKVCYRLIKGTLKERHYTFYTKEEVRDKAAIATDYLVRRYKNYWTEKHEIYFIRDGFIRALQDACRYALDYVGREDLLDKTKNLNQISRKKGIPLDEEQIEEWQQSFMDVEESIAFMIWKKEQEVNNNE